MFLHPHGTFSHYIENRASVLVIMFTSEPHMSCNISYRMTFKLGEYSEGLVNKIRK